MKYVFITTRERKNIPKWCLNNMLCIDWNKNSIQKKNCVSCGCPFIMDKQIITVVVK